MAKETTSILRQGKKTSKMIINKNIDYLVYALQEYAEREGWRLK